MATVTSADGTTIAYDRLGDGPPLILIGGLLYTRAVMRPLAKVLAQRFTVINYDRRGRGDSEDAGAYLIERELEDLGALIDEIGGPADLYGHSAGAALALRAPGHQLPVGRMVLHEPPFRPDEASERARARSFAAELQPLLDRGDDDAVLRLALGAVELPIPDRFPRDLLAIAHTVGYDSAIVGDAQGGTVPIGIASEVKQPVLVIAGDASPPWMVASSTQLADALPDATRVVLPEQQHVVSGAILLPVLTGFLLP